MWYAGPEIVTLSTDNTQTEEQVTTEEINRNTSIYLAVAGVIAFVSVIVTFVIIFVIIVVARHSALNSVKPVYEKLTERT